MKKSITGIIIFSTIIIFFLNSCKRDPALYEVNNLNGNIISALGHAGMGIGFKYPIDTYESIEPVLHIGADGSEMDIQMTKDSVLVIFHDFRLEDMSTCTTGLINDKRWSDIRGCHIASPYSSTIKIISFNELMDDLTSAGYNIHNYTFTFDCKLYTNSTNQSIFFNQYANALLKVMDDYMLQNNLLIESQDTAFIRILKNKRSGLKLFIYPNNFEEGLRIAKAMNLFGITIHTDYISALQLKIAHDNGFRVALWGINTNKANIDAIQKNPDFIQTDKPIHLLKVFGKYKR